MEEEPEDISIGIVGLVSRIFSAFNFMLSGGNVYGSTCYGGSTVAFQGTF
jgi:hypothetical protein